MDVDRGLKHGHMYIIEKHTRESLNLQICNSFASCRDRQSPLTKWWVSLVFFNTIFGACLHWGVTQIVDFKIGNIIGKEACLLDQVLKTIYKAQIHIRASSSILYKYICGLAAISSWGIWESSCHVKAYMMVWGGGLEHSLSRRDALRSLGAIKDQGHVYIIVMTIDHDYHFFLISRWFEKFVNIPLHFTQWHQKLKWPCRRMNEEAKWSELESPSHSNFATIEPK